jgi:hypothetical protein
MVGRAGLEPACLLLIRQAPSPAWLPASWPPRSRTARYLFIGQAPSTGWVVASGRRRTRTPALSRPAGFKPVAARLAASSSLRKAEALIPSARAPSPLRTGARTGRVRFPWRKTEVLIPRAVTRPTRFPAGGQHPAGFIFHVRRAEHSKPTPESAHSLAARPGSLTGSLSLRTLGGGRTLTSEDTRS